MRCFGGQLRQQNLEQEVKWLQQVLAKEQQSKQAALCQLRDEQAKRAMLEQEILYAAQAAQEMGESLCMFFNPCYQQQQQEQPGEQPCDGQQQLLVQPQQQQEGQSHLLPSQESHLTELDQHEVWMPLHQPHYQQQQQQQQLPHEPSELAGSQAEQAAKPCEDPDLDTAAYDQAHAKHTEHATGTLRLSSSIDRLGSAHSASQDQQQQPQSPCSRHSKGLHTVHRASPRRLARSSPSRGSLPSSSSPCKSSQPAAAGTDVGAAAGSLAAQAAPLPGVSSARQPEGCPADATGPMDGGGTANGSVAAVSNAPSTPGEADARQQQQQKQQQQQSSGPAEEPVAAETLAATGALVALPAPARMPHQNASSTPQQPGSKSGTTSAGSPYKAAAVAAATAIQQSVHAATVAIAAAEAARGTHHSSSSSSDNRTTALTAGGRTASTTTGAPHTAVHPEGPGNGLAACGSSMLAPMGAAGPCKHSASNSSSKGGGLCSAATSGSSSSCTSAVAHPQLPADVVAATCPTSSDQQQQQQQQEGKGGSSTANGTGAFLAKGSKVPLPPAPIQHLHWTQHHTQPQQQQEQDGVVTGGSSSGSRSDSARRKWDVPAAAVAADQAAVAGGAKQQPVIKSVLVTTADSSSCTSSRNCEGSSSSGQMVVVDAPSYNGLGPVLSTGSQQKGSSTKPLLAAADASSASDGCLAAHSQNQERSLQPAAPAGTSSCTAVAAEDVGDDGMQPNTETEQHPMEFSPVQGLTQQRLAACRQQQQQEHVIQQRLCSMSGDGNLQQWPAAVHGFNSSSSGSGTAQHHPSSRDGQHPWSTTAALENSNCRAVPREAAWQPIHTQPLRQQSPWHRVPAPSLLPQGQGVQGPQQGCMTVGPLQHGAMSMGGSGSRRSSPSAQMNCLAPLTWHQHNLGSSRENFMQAMMLSACNRPGSVLRKQMAFDQEDRPATTLPNLKQSKAAMIAAAQPRKRWLLQLF